MVDERIVEQQKEIYENAMRRHKKRSGIGFLVLVCTVLFAFFGGQLSDKVGEWLELLPLAGFVFAFLCSLMRPLSADSDLSSHIKSVKLFCLLVPMVFIVGVFLLASYIESGAQTGRGTQFVQAMALGVVLLALASFYVKKSYLTGLFDQYGQIE